MKYRKLDANGDRVFGHANDDFHIDTPDGVAQAARTRLRQYLAEWFNDTSDGTDWNGRVLGTGTQDSYALELRTRILETPGLLEISSFSTTRNPDQRTLNVSVEIDTIYGRTSFATPHYVSPPLVPPPLQPTQLIANDGTVLTGLDGALLFDPKLPLP